MNKSCLSDEMIACYAEGRLTGNDLVSVESHLKLCTTCAEIVSIQKECVLAREKGEFSYVPDTLVERLKKELILEPSIPLLEIIISFKEKVLEAIRTTGEFLPLSSIQPAYALRGEAVSNDSIVIREIFQGIEITVEITAQGGEYFRALVKTIDMQTSMPKEDLRVNLLQGQTELESYKTIRGMSIFESLKAGDYLLQIFHIDKVIGNIKMTLKSV